MLCGVMCRHSRAMCCKLCLLAERIVQKIRKEVFVRHENEMGKLMQILQILQYVCDLWE
jgi:hypothetical protein